MSELLIALLLGLVIGEFWRSRQQSELANRLVAQYCQRQGWQLVSVSRDTAEMMPLLLRELLRKPSCFLFEFSSDGLSQGSGELILTGLTSPLFRVSLPEAVEEESQACARIAEHPDNIIPFPNRRH